MYVHYVAYRSMAIPLDSILNKNLHIQLEDGIVLGEIGIVGGISYRKAPIHKRVWYKIKRIFSFGSKYK